MAGELMSILVVLVEAGAVQRSMHSMQEMQCMATQPCSASLCDEEGEGLGAPHQVGQRGLSDGRAVTLQPAMQSVIGMQCCRAVWWPWHGN